MRRGLSDDWPSFFLSTCTGTLNLSGRSGCTIRIKSSIWNKNTPPCKAIKTSEKMWQNQYLKIF